MRGQANAYFFVPVGSADAVRFDPLEPTSRPTFDCSYYGKVLEHFERRFPNRGLDFYLTSDIDSLPAYGANVIAILRGDEWCRVPHYTHQVGATFKMYGTRMSAGIGLRQPPSLLLASIFHYCHMTRRRIRPLIEFGWHRIRMRAKARPIVTIPLGYFRQVNLPMKSFDERRIDICFNGSIRQLKHSRSPLRRLLPSSKEISRKRMLLMASSYAEKRPALRVLLKTLPEFFQGTADEAEAYSHQLMNSRICLVPRGNNLETFRYFEALRAGCVVICEMLPDYWFYRNSPAIILKDWSLLEITLNQLLSNPRDLHRLHREAIAHWNSILSESSIGDFIGSILTENRLI